MPFVVAIPFELFVGPHNILSRKGMELNNREDPRECIWIDEFTGFETTDLRIGEQDNVAEDGQTPDPGFHGGKTMTITGSVRSRSYIGAMQTGARFRDSMLDISGEDPLDIFMREDALYFHPRVQIMCRPSEFRIDTKIAPEDLSGLFRRSFTAAFKATDPTYKAVDEKSLTIIPTVISELGFIFPLTFDLVFNTSIDSEQNPIEDPEVDTSNADNLGNWKSKPRIRFTGPMEGASLINQTNGQVVRLSEPLESGQYIELYDGSITNEFGQPAADKWDPRSDWMILDGVRDGSDGNNLLNLIVKGYGGGSRVDVWWKDTWI